MDSDKLKPKIMRRDPKLLRAQREATQKAVKDLEDLKLSTAETRDRVVSLRRELLSLWIQNRRRIVNDAKSIVNRAKECSARHRRELMEIRKTAQRAATLVRGAKSNTKLQTLPKPSWLCSQSAYRFSSYI